MALLCQDRSTTYLLSRDYRCDTDFCRLQVECQSPFPNADNNDTVVDGSGMEAISVAFLLLFTLITEHKSNQTATYLSWLTMLCPVVSASVKQPNTRLLTEYIFQIAVASS